MQGGSASIIKLALRGWPAAIRSFPKILSSCLLQCVGVRVLEAGQLISYNGLHRVQIHSAPASRFHLPVDPGTLDLAGRPSLNHCKNTPLMARENSLPCLTRGPQKTATRRCQDLYYMATHTRTSEPPPTVKQSSGGYAVPGLMRISPSGLTLCASTSPTMPRRRPGLQ